jgi:hypothetical protein
LFVQLCPLVLGEYCSDLAHAVLNLFFHMVLYLVAKASIFPLEQGRPDSGQRW